jgi:hypothetical protein
MDVSRSIRLEMIKFARNFVVQPANKEFVADIMGIGYVSVFVSVYLTSSGRLQQRLQDGDEAVRKEAALVGVSPSRFNSKLGLAIRIFVLIAADHLPCGGGEPGPRRR